MNSCQHLGHDGKCHGQYKGFLCIKDKCRMQRTEHCPHSAEEGSYCHKFQRFECIGKENCGSYDDYVLFLRTRREKAHP